MPGAPSTDQFFFSTATVLVGPQTDQVSLTPSKHSIGLVKNVSFEANPSTVDLTQGIQNDVVMQIVNNLDVKASMEVYEYTSRNLAYGLGLDGSLTKYTSNTDVFLTTSSTAAAATTIIVTSDVTQKIAAGDWGFIQDGTDDKVHIFKVASVATTTGNTTITITGWPIPASVTFSAGSRVGKVAKIDFDANATNAFFSVRVIGTLIKDKRPIVLHCPKVRITKGFSLKFASDGFGNMPFEFAPLLPISTDPGYTSEFNQRIHVFNP